MRVLAGLCGISLCVLTSVSCGGSSTTGPSGGAIVRSCAGGSFSGTMTATISGRSFTATCLLAGSFGNGIVSIGGTDVAADNISTFQDIAIAIKTTVPGTFSLAPLPDGGNPNNSSYSIGGSQFWDAGATFGGSGTVTITALSATSVSGTFTINYVAGPGGSGTKTLTNGTFTITF